MVSSPVLNARDRAPLSLTLALAAPRSGARRTASGFFSLRRGRRVLEPVRPGGHDELVALLFREAVFGEYAALVLGALGGVLGAAARFLALLLRQLVGGEVGEIVEC